MAEKFDPKHAAKLENPDRLVEMPPARLIELLELTGAETVVDFGAGTGMYSLPIAGALPQGELIAVDEQQVLLDRLRQKLAGRPEAERVRVVVNDDGHVALPDAVADRLVMINVVHHVHDDPAALAEALRLLAPSGLLLVAEFARMDRPVGPPSDHVLALDELRTVLSRLGLRELAIHAPGTIALYHTIILSEKPPA